MCLLKFRRNSNHSKQPFYCLAPMRLQVFFFLRIRRPPSSPLFPYPPPSRPPSDARPRRHRPARAVPAAARVAYEPASTRYQTDPLPPCRTGVTSAGTPASAGAAGRQRSEEHTSELQSPCNLVCRLLLEKKKK